MEGETVIAGVDTHKDVHVLCLLDGLGRKIRSGSFGADPEGYDRLAEAIGDPGSCMVVGVEGTASYGAGLTRRLAELGYNVVEVLRPKRDKARPGEGKSDPLDAERAARKVDETGEEVLRAPVRIEGSAPANCLLTTYRSVGFASAQFTVVEGGRFIVVNRYSFEMVLNRWQPFCYAGAVSRWATTLAGRRWRSACGCAGPSLQGSS